MFHHLPNVDSFLKNIDDTAELENVLFEDLSDQEEVTDEAPIIRLVSLLILEAFKKRASDIHIEPLASKLRVRYRIDGVLKEVESPPKYLQANVISRIKIMANIDIAEKRLPQDGRIYLKLQVFMG